MDETAKPLAYREAKQAERDSDVVELDPDGDITLRVEDETGTANQSFLVSSHILKLSSEVFMKMLSPPFKEGMDLRSKEHPTICLKEDDPQTMAIILRILHHQTSDVSLSIEPKKAAAIALHCDKYSLIEALKPWSANWCRTLDGDLSTKDVGYALLSAHVLQSPGFEDIAVEAVKRLPPDFVSTFEEDDTIALLPTDIITRLQRRIVRALHLLQTIIQNVERTLHNQTADHSVAGRYCVACNGDNPENVRICRFCYTRGLQQKICTRESRIADYFEILSCAGLWPSVDQYTTCSMVDILNRIRTAVEDRRHQCGAGKACPLRCEIQNLADSVQKRMAKMRWSEDPGREVGKPLSYDNSSEIIDLVGSG